MMQRLAELPGWAMDHPLFMAAWLVFVGCLMGLALRLR